MCQMYNVLWDFLLVKKTESTEYVIEEKGTLFEGLLNTDYYPVIL